MGVKSLLQTHVLCGLFLILGIICCGVIASLAVIKTVIEAKAMNQQICEITTPNIIYSNVRKNTININRYSGALSFTNKDGAEVVVQDKYQLTCKENK